MRFACEQCQTKYSIPDERVRGKILKIRCKNCACLIAISEAGVRTARPADAAKGGLAEGDKEGGDSTMIGGIAEFFGKQGLPGDSADWHLSIDGNQNGPMQLSDLAQRIVEQFDSSAEMFVWKDGFEGWKQYDSISEVNTAVGKARGGARRDPEAAKPAAGAALPSLDSEGGGDATQIGSLNLPLDFGKSEEDLVEDASLLDIEPEAIEPVKGAATSAKPPARPPAKPSPPPPKAPPPFKAPPPRKAPSLPPRAPTPSPKEQRPAPPPASAPASVPPNRPPAPLFKTLPHPGLRSLGPELSEPPPSRPSPSVPPQPAPLPDAATMPPSPSMAPPAAPSVNLGSSSSGLRNAGPMGLKSAEPSVIGSLQFAGATFDTPPVPLSQPGVPPAREAPKWPLIAGLGLILALSGGATVWLLKKPTKPKSTQNPPTVLVDAGAPSDLATPADAAAKPTGPLEANVTKKGPEKSVPAVKGPEKKGADKDAELEGVSAGDFKALLESGEAALSKCYEKALKKNAGLAGKQMKISLSVNAKGKPGNISIAGDGVEEEAKLTKCVAKALKKWKFPKGPSKKPYSARFALTIQK